MKKKHVIIGVVVVIAVFGIVKLKDYYTDRYVEDDVYYVRVPENQSTEIDDLLDDQGKAVDKGKEYEFTGYNTKGESKVLTFSYQTEDSNKLLQPNQYLKISSSKTVVLGEEVIEEKDVPTNILPFIK